MSRHEPFAFKTSSDLLKKAKELSIELPFQKDISPLLNTYHINSVKLPNRFAVHPMEGFDAKEDGTPGELTFRRYKRFAEGGSGLIWFEAFSVIPEARSNPHQLMITNKNLDSFKRLVEHTRNSAYKKFGNSHIFLVTQLNHSGRFSKSEGKLTPLSAQHNPFLDKNPDNVHILSDNELDYLQDKYIDSAKLAEKAGFDAVDIKACHGYLIHDLITAHTRRDSKYGGNFENRTRFLTEIIQKIREQISGVGTAVRMNIYDGIPYPYGFGVSEASSLKIDLTEPKILIEKLADFGCKLINVSTGIPYYNPHLGRPFDRAIPCSDIPDEHPLEGVAHLLNITGELQKHFPKITIVGTGYSWLRQFFPNVAAAVLERGEASLIGLGRSSFAYPDAPKDIMIAGEMNPDKVCISCSHCTELMRNNQACGCVIRDKDIYSR